jgi:hypothetical protein
MHASGSIGIVREDGASDMLAMAGTAILAAVLVEPPSHLHLGLKPIAATASRQRHIIMDFTSLFRHHSGNSTVGSLHVELGDSEARSKVSRVFFSFASLQTRGRIHSELSDRNYKAKTLLESLLKLSNVRNHACRIGPVQFLCLVNDDVISLRKKRKSKLRV